MSPASDLTIALCLLAAPLTSPPAAAQDAAEAGAQREPQLGVELAAMAGEVNLTFEELDDLLLWRHGRSRDGSAALRQLLELRVLDHLAAEQGFVVTGDMLARRWSQLDAEIKASGTQGGLPAYLEENEVSVETFREYLRLALVHEELTRRALGVEDETPITGEQQSAWLQSVLEERGYEERAHPWSDGVVARSGDLTIERDEFAAHLRTMLPEDEMTDACYQLLLEKCVRARMPDLAEDALAEGVEAEIGRRRADAEADSRFAGVSYEQLLEAKGLSIEILRRDPAIRVAALARLWVDRAHDEESLRTVYSDERDFFDGLFGEGVEVHVIFLRGARFTNELTPRTFEQAEEELVSMRTRIAGLEDFRRLAGLHSEDTTTREQGGRMGVVTRGAVTVPEPIRAACFGALDRARAADQEDVSGELLGPVRIQGGAVLLALGARRPAPAWADMALQVHRELRRRYLDEQLPRSSVATWLDRG